MTTVLARLLILGLMIEGLVIAPLIDSGGAPRDPGVAQLAERRSPVHGPLTEVAGSTPASGVKRGASSLPEPSYPTANPRLISANLADPTPEPSYPIVLDLSDPRCAPTDPGTVVTECIDYGGLDPLWTPPPPDATPAPCPTEPVDWHSVQCPGPTEEPTP